MARQNLVNYWKRHSGLTKKHTMITRRHGFTLTLIAWYLMVPPSLFNSTITVDLDAPLSKWSVYSVFDSAHECQYGKIDAYLHVKQQVQAHPENRKLRILWDQITESQCIASHDQPLAVSH
jgi:hypothetical protein